MVLSPTLCLSQQSGPPGAVINLQQTELSLKLKGNNRKDLDPSGYGLYDIFYYDLF